LVGRLAGSSRYWTPAWLSAESGLRVARSCRSGRICTQRCPRNLGMRVLGLSRTGHPRSPQDPYWQGVSRTFLRLGLRWASHFRVSSECPDVHLIPLLHLRRDSHVRGDGRMSPFRHWDPPQLYCLGLITCVNRDCRYCSSTKVSGGCCWVSLPPAEQSIRSCGGALPVSRCGCASALSHEGIPGSGWRSGLSTLSSVIEQSCVSAAQAER
jgi:hypothetical protein